MAEVSNLHRLNTRQPPQQQQSRIPISSPSTGTREVEEEEIFEHNPIVIDLDSLSPPNNANPSFFIPDDYDNNINFGFDLNIESEDSVSEYADSLADPNCFFYGGREDEEQMNFVTNLFESREAYLPDHPIWEFDSGLSEDLGMEFGFGPVLVSEAEVSLPGGLRVVGMDSESDSEEFEVNSGFIDNNDENEREELEWEEVNERIQFDESGNLNSVIDRIEEISVSSDFSSSDGENLQLGDMRGEERNIEWEVLLAVNNFDTNFDFESQEEHNNGNEVPHLDLSEDYILTVEYGTLFGQLVENENTLKGSPPAAKSVVENLPLVELTKEEVGEENNDAVVCTVCKDDVLIGEKAIRMPCSHLYHGDCILPWLKIRNTCPVCRYELPTDDLDYEKRKTLRSGVGIASRSVDDLNSRYSFELLP